MIMVQKILGKSDISGETKRKKEEARGVWLSGRLHIKERLNEGPRLFYVLAMIDIIFLYITYLLRAV